MENRNTQCQNKQPKKKKKKNRVWGTSLRKHYDYRARFLDINQEFGAIVASGPFHLKRCPVLRDGPFRTEQARSVEVLELLQEIFIRDPKDLGSVLSSIIHCGGRRQPGA